MAVRMEAATAMIAFLGPGRGLMRWNLACRELCFVFTAAQEHCTSIVLSQGAPLRRRLDRRLPALSSLRGHMPAHEMRCAADGNRLMSIPISETMTWAPRFLKPGIDMISSTAVRKGP